MSPVGTAVHGAEQSASVGDCCDQARPGGKAPRNAYRWFVEHAQHCGTLTAGQHHRNYLAPLVRELAVQVGRRPGSPVKVRLPLDGALRVVPRTWRSESRILAALQDRVPDVPACLIQRRRSSVHAYVEGADLSALCPPGKPVDDVYVQALAGLFATLATVPRDALPRLPFGWPKDGDSSGYLRRLASLTETKVRRPNWPRFGSLFNALDLPADAMRAFARQVPALQRRPFALLHTDLHRGNLIVKDHVEATAGPLAFLDWELASFGDPLHDLATHLVRMSYPVDQHTEVIAAWRRAMLDVRPEAVQGLSSDLPHYLAFERFQSVYPDVMRAATGLLSAPEPASGLDSAVNGVRSALRLAREPLGLRPVDDRDRIAAALLDWCHSQRKSGRRRESRAMDE